MLHIFTYPILMFMPCFWKWIKCLSDQKGAPFLTLTFHAMFGKQAKTIPFTKKNFDGAFLLHSAFSESAFFESAFFEGAFLESAFLESAISETYQEKLSSNKILCPKLTNKTLHYLALVWHSPATNSNTTFLVKLLLEVIGNREREREREKERERERESERERQRDRERGGKRERDTEREREREWG